MSDLSAARRELWTGRLVAWPMQDRLLNSERAATRKARKAHIRQREHLVNMREPLASVVRRSRNSSGSRSDVCVSDFATVCLCVDFPSHIIQCLHHYLPHVNTVALELAECPSNAEPSKSTMPPKRLGYPGTPRMW